MSAEFLRRLSRACAAFLVIFGLFASTPARADFLTEAENKIDDAGIFPYKFSELRDVLATCETETGKADTEIAACVEALANSKAGQDTGVPSWLPRMIQAYIDIRNKDFEQLVKDVGPAIACAVAQIITGGVDVCGILSDFVSLIPGAQKALNDRVNHIFDDVGGLNNKPDPRAGVGNGGAPTSNYRTVDACPKPDVAIPADTYPDGSVYPSCDCPAHTVMMNFDGTPITPQKGLTGRYFTCKSQCPSGQILQNGSCIPLNSGYGVSCPYGQKASTNNQSCVPVCQLPNTKLYKVCGVDICLGVADHAKLSAKVNPVCQHGPATCSVTVSSPVIDGASAMDRFGAFCPTGGVVSHGPGTTPTCPAGQHAPLGGQCRACQPGYSWRVEAGKCVKGAPEGAVQ